MLALVVPACALTESRHFGVSVSVDGALMVWFRHCVEPPGWPEPQRVSVYSLGGGGQRLWAIVDDSPNRHDFPTALEVGETPAGYRTDIRLLEPIPDEGRFRVSFSAGEAWYEHVEFERTELRADMVLTFDRSFVSPAGFRRQTC